MMGKALDDEVSVRLPGGLREFVITSLQTLPEILRRGAEERERQDGRR